MYQWYRLTPISLTRKKPITELVLSRFFCEIIGHQVINNIIMCLMWIPSCKITWQRKNCSYKIIITIFKILNSTYIIWSCILRKHDNSKRKIVFLCKIKIPLIMCRTLDNPRSIIRQRITRNPEREFCISDRVNEVSTCKYSLMVSNFLISSTHFLIIDSLRKR